MADGRQRAPKTGTYTNFTSEDVAKTTFVFSFMVLNSILVARFFIDDQLAVGTYYFLVSFI